MIFRPEFHHRKKSKQYFKKLLIILLIFQEITDNLINVLIEFQKKGLNSFTKTSPVFSPATTQRSVYSV